MNNGHASRRHRKKTAFATWMLAWTIASILAYKATGNQIILLAGLTIAGSPPGLYMLYRRRLISSMLSFMLMAAYGGSVIYLVDPGYSLNILEEGVSPYMAAFWGILTGGLVSFTSAMYYWLEFLRDSSLGSIGLSAWLFNALMSAMAGMIVMSRGRLGSLASTTGLIIIVLTLASGVALALSMGG
ncbi:MAG: hypothetical protein GSR78_03310 [Desulfurococcales archaeon]|nr:hypothetical protein [Desulfurococcales archaeon]